jgi:alpha-tubulin suppressor-like RCC1 family protein
MTGDTTFFSLTTGAFHTCGITVEGIAWCWGRDSWGQLGNSGSSSDELEPTLVEVSGMTGEKAFVQIAGGYQHTCGLTAEGVVWCWGDDGDGQLGDDGPSIGSQVRVEVNTNTITVEKAFVHIETYGYSSCGITADGLAWCWGRDDDGQLGNGPVYHSAGRPYPVDTSTMAGELTQLGMALGLKHGCSVTSDGTPWCFGSGGFGQLGNGGTSAQSPDPVDVSAMLGSRVLKELTAGIHHTCAISGDGISWCWGRDWNGQLGNGGSDTDSQIPTAVTTATMTGSLVFVQLTGGSGHTCGFTNGYAWCWGRDTYGGLGNGGGVNHTGSPDAVDRSDMGGDQNLIGISIAGNHSCGLSSRGSVWCWGRDNQGQLGNGGSPTDAHSPMPLDTSPMSGEIAFSHIAAGNSHTCGLTAKGTAWCWGYDGSGQLGDGGFISTSQSPKEVNRGLMTGLIQLTAGSDHTCGLTAVGVAWCWGSDEFGQLGDSGTSNNAQSPVQVDTSDMSGETAFILLAAGANHTCGLTGQGRSWCWGSDSAGQLGDGGTSVDTQDPVEVNTGEFFVHLASQDSHTCGLTARGVAWCWGSDTYGQLGNGGGSASTQSPVLVDTSPL